MKKLIYLAFAVVLLAFTSTSYAGFGVDSGSYVINVSKTPVLQEGVVNVPVKSLLAKIVNESLDKSKTIQVLGAGEEANLLKEVGSLYGYNIAVGESNVKGTSSYLDVADMPISSFVIADELASSNVSLDKVLNAFYEVEKSGYQADALSNAMGLLTQFLSLFTAPIDAIVNSVASGETVSTFVSTIIDLLSSLAAPTEGATTSKAPEYSVLEERLIGEPLGRVMATGINALNAAVVNPALTALTGSPTMPAAVTRTAVMGVMFPALDVLLNSVPISRQFFMDFVAPIMSHAH